MTPFIADQGWQLLTEIQHPEPYLEASRFRAGRPDAPTPPGLGDEEYDPWVPIDDHLDVASNSLELPKIGHVDLSRLVITTDAGLGKSVAIQWLWAACNRWESGSLAVIVPHKEIEGPSNSLHDRLRDFLAGQIRNQALDLNCRPEDACRIVDRYRRLGRLVLLFDSLDQIGDHVEPLQAIVQSPYWSACRIVIAGRPGTDRM